MPPDALLATPGDLQPNAGRGHAQMAERRVKNRLTLASGQVLATLDALLLALLWPLALGLADGSGAPAGRAFWAALIVFPAATMLAFYAVGLYRRETIVSSRHALARLPAASALGAIAGVLCLLPFAPPAPAPATAAAAAALVVPAGMAALIAGALSRLAFGTLRRRGVFSRTVLILGAGRRAWDLVHLLRAEGRTVGYEFEFLHDPALGTIDPRLLDGSVRPVRLMGAGGVLAAARTVNPDEIVVAPDERRGMDLHGLLDCKIEGFPISEYLGFLEREVRRVDIKRIELGWLLYSDGFHMGLLDRALKRTLDIVVSGAVLLALAPAMLIIMAAIRLQDGGPALYRQTRVTRGGREFEVLKLRTMRTDAECGGAVWAASEDPRITRLGQFLRRSRLDEVPQLVNVLRGQMSFVGPRPERPEFVAMLATHIPLYYERHAVKTGLTGWAQVNYPYGASIDDARSKLSYDLYYVKNFSVLLDILIILQTIRVVLWPGNSVR